MTRTMRRSRPAAILGVIAAIGVTIVVPASATAAPSAASGLTGTWTSGSATSGIVKLVIRSSGGGGITVDTFSACGKRKRCQSGKLPAVVFGSDVSSTRGASFQTNQAFASFNRVLVGNLVSTRRGRRITLDWYDVYHTGNRSNTVVSRTFKRVGRAKSTTKKGTSTAAYLPGRQPRMPDAFVGVWHNVNKAARGLVELDITRAADGSLLVHAFGACTPTPCDNGTTAAIAYGRSTSSTTGTRFLSPVDYGFKRGFLTSLPISSSGILTVSSYNEFTDGSSRSNYVNTERFKK